MSVETVTTITSNVLSVAVNLWVLYQVRLIIGKEASRVASKVDDAVRKIVD
jgi:hypothetical protein